MSSYVFFREHTRRINAALQKSLNNRLMLKAYQQRRSLDEREYSAEIALCFNKHHKLNPDVLAQVAKFLIHKPDSKCTAEDVMTRSIASIDTALTKLKKKKLAEKNSLNWGKAAVIISFMRANKDNVLRYSILGLLNRFAPLMAEIPQHSNTAAAHSQIVSSDLQNNRNPFYSLPNSEKPDDNGGFKYSL